MSGDAVIRAEGLGKRYLIGHQVERHGYVALRDVLGRSLRNMARSAGDFLSGKPMVGGDAVEEFWALRNLDFQIKPGEVVGVLGRNGAGKSTLLKILSRITEPSEGRVTIRGRVASLLEVGTGFHPELTGRENIFLNGAIMGMGREEVRRKFNEIVAFAEIEKFLDTPVKRYSSGMYVRLAFAVAAHLEPEILLVDEVLAVGDVAFQRKCLGKMKDVADHGRTVLFVSHNVNAIRQLCQTSLFLEPARPARYFDDVGQAISLYMSAGGAPLPSWRAGGDEAWRNPYFNPVSIDALAPDGLSEGELIHPQDQPLTLQLTAEVDRAEPLLSVGFDVITAEGIHLFRTCATDGDPAAWPRLVPGLNRLKLTIPGGLLNEGEYTLRLTASLHYVKWLFETNGVAPAIAVTVGSPVTRSPYWQVTRPGVLAPLLTWENA